MGRWWGYVALWGLWGWWGVAGGAGGLKVARRQRSWKALIALNWPTMPARLPVDRWDL